VAAVALFFVSDRGIRRGFDVVVRHAPIPFQALATERCRAGFLGADRGAFGGFSVRTRDV
jgi:hypothetical protein